MCIVMRWWDLDEGGYIRIIYAINNKWQHDKSGIASKLLQEMWWARVSSL